MLTLERVSLSYGGVSAVDGVSLDIEPGSRVALIGPNGAGKSSLLNLMGGQARSSSGRIGLGGHDITGAKPHRRARLGISRSFQIASLYPNLSVREQASFALLRHNRLGWAKRCSSPRLRAQVADLLSDWRIEPEAWDRCPEELSYGQKRALELALALARGPRVLLLDEPNVGLTAAENAELMERIRSFERDLTVVLVAHDMDMVFGLAERVVVMHRGQLVVDGDPDTVRNNPTVAEIYLGGEESR
jgi:branched-chain amino acid transport system ATP-binding protein